MDNIVLNDLIKKVAEYNIEAVETVKKAYDELEKEGFIKTVQGKGSFVSPKNLELLREEKLKEIQEHIETIKDIATISDISKEEIKEIFEIIFGEEI